MAKQTLLDIVQDILVSMESDQVDSITDTDEAASVARLVRRAYWDTVLPLDLAEHKKLFQLDASGDSSIPTVMYVPEEVAHIDWIKYDHTDTNDTTTQYKPVVYCSLEAFLDLTHQLRTDESNVETMTITDGDDTITFLFRNDKAPEYYTSFNDYTLIFDSYDADEESTLQKSKTLCYGKELPAFTLSDTFTPDLDDEQFPILVNDAKALCFAELKQTTHARAERTSRENKVRSQKDKRRTEGVSEFDRLPNYGKKT